MFFNAALRGYRQLFQFSGREGRQQFWCFIGLNMLFVCAALSALMGYAFVTGLEAAREFALANPDKATIETGPGTYSITIHDSDFDPMPERNLLLGGTLAIGIVAILVFAAAVVRRLHDLGKSGWWGTVPAILFIVSSVSMAQMFGSDLQDFDLQSFIGVWLLTMLYILSLSILGLACAFRGQAETNRFGPPPGSTDGAAP